MLGSRFLGGFPGSSVPCCAALSTISSSSTSARISRKPTRLKSRPNILNTSLRQTAQDLWRRVYPKRSAGPHSKLFTAPFLHTTCPFRERLGHPRLWGAKKKFPPRTLRIA